MLRQKYRKNVKASAFIRKLHCMVEEEQRGGLIGWAAEEGGFAVRQVGLFTTTLLPRYFKHKNYASFLRQLNMYNFTKLRTDDESLQLFHHPLFQRGRPELHKEISRREQGRRDERQGREGEGREEGREGRTGLGERIADLGRQQEELMEQCSQLISDNADIMDDNFILKATIGDQTLNHRIILETITSFLRTYHPSACPASQQTHISSLLDTLERTHSQETLWAGKWQGALRNFITMVEHNELRSVLKWINSSMSIGNDKKKKNSFTIVGQEERLTLPMTAFFTDF